MTTAGETTKAFARSRETDNGRQLTTTPRHELAWFIKGSMQPNTNTQTA